jgi:BirA family transcriptional regulator, biotin operon repressor / biotin---[acetyl-CoA-carboxylase] ligase
LRLLASGAGTPFWVVADEQSHGRGRAGRHWHSPKGNLYATLALRLSAGPSTATQLSFVAALAVYDAAASLLPPEQLAALRLKWPNDVLLAGAKLAGILIESVMAPNGNGLAVAAGIGINAASAPADTGRAVATLGLGAGGSAAAFEALADAFETWLARWDQARGFAAIREAWLARAHVRGEPLNVRLNGASIGGRFRGVDERGALQLETDAGVVITVNAGDIYPAAQS